MEMHLLVCKAEQVSVQLLHMEAPAADDWLIEQFNGALKPVTGHTFVAGHGGGDVRPVNAQ
jgi:hypothetical protein